MKFSTITLQAIAIAMGIAGVSANVAANDAELLFRRQNSGSFCNTIKCRSKRDCPNQSCINCGRNGYCTGSTNNQCNPHQCANANDCAPPCKACVRAKSGVFAGGKQCQ